MVNLGVGSLRGAMGWCWVWYGLLWGAPLVEELSQIVYGMKLGVASCGRCLVYCTGDNVECMKNYVLSSEVWL